MVRNRTSLLGPDSAHQQKESAAMNASKSKPKHRQKQLPKGKESQAPLLGQQQQQQQLQQQWFQQQQQQQQQQQFLQWQQQRQMVTAQQQFRQQHFLRLGQQHAMQVPKLQQQQQQLMLMQQMQMTKAHQMANAQHIANTQQQMLLGQQQQVKHPTVTRSEIRIQQKLDLKSAKNRQYYLKKRKDLCGKLAMKRSTVKKGEAKEDEKEVAVIDSKEDDESDDGKVPPAQEQEKVVAGNAAVETKEKRGAEEPSFPPKKQKLANKSPIAELLWDTQRRHRKEMEDLERKQADWAEAQEQELKRLHESENKRHEERLEELRKRHRMLIEGAKQQQEQARTTLERYQQRELESLTGNLPVDEGMHEDNPKAAVSRIWLGGMRAEYRLLLREQKETKRRHKNDRKDRERELKQKEEELLERHKKEQEEREEHNKQEIIKLEKRHAEELHWLDEKQTEELDLLNDKIRPKVSLVAELEEVDVTIKAFCDWNDKGFLVKIADFLDPVSLFRWGLVICDACTPPTKEARNLVDALGSVLLGKTVLPAFGCTCDDTYAIFQDPNKFAAGEDETVVARVKFVHSTCTDLTEPTTFPNAFYDNLDEIQKQQLHIQWHRKRTAMNGGVTPRQMNHFFHRAFGYRGRYGSAEIDGNCDDRDLNELGAFAGNSQGGLYALFEAIILRAKLVTENAERRYVLLEDFLYAVDGLNIKFSFPVETRHTISLLDGRTISATPHEIASFEPGFRVEEPDIVYEGGKLWGNYSSLGEIVSKAWENIKNHMNAGPGSLSRMKDIVGGDLSALRCNCDEDDVSASECLFVPERETTDDSIEREALSRQAIVRNELTLFGKDVIPSMQPMSKPDLRGDSLLFFRSCNFALREHDSKFRVSFSASLFLQQLIEDLGLGVALQPFLIRHPQVDFPFLCHIVVGRRGATLVPTVFVAQEANAEGKVTIYKNADKALTTDDGIGDGSDSDYSVDGAESAEDL